MALYCFKKLTLPFCSLLVCSLFLGLTTSAQDIRPFTVRYTTDARGKMVMVTNNIITTKKKSGGSQVAYTVPPPGCPPSGFLCKNDDNNPTNIDIDGDPTTFNSSSAQLLMPTCHSVAYAALYWGAGIAIGQGANGSLPMRASNWNNVRFKTPGGVYQTVTAAVTDTVKTVFHGYQCFADVTDLVRSAGVGSYTVANVKCDTVNASNAAIVNAYGGWTMMVIYADPSQPLRNFTIFDGLTVIGNSSGINSKDITVTGFRCPPSGNISATVGTVVYDGDRGEADGFFIKKNSDGIFVNQTATGESAKAKANTNDAWNSSITDTGTVVTTRVPADQLTYGFDAHQFRLANTGNRYLRNNDNSAVIRISTSSEGYVLGLVTAEIDTYYPELILENDMVPLHNTGMIQTGDTLQITSTVRNTGNSTATGVRAEDLLPNYFMFVPNSIIIDNAGKTDIAGDDAAEYNAATRTVIGRLGLGGAINSNDAVYSMAYKVIVTAACRTDAVALNQQTKLYYQDQASSVIDSTSSRPRSLDNCVAAIGANTLYLSACPFILAVKLESFTGTKTSGGHLLQWTSFEHNDASGYTVESSIDGTNFKVIDSREVPRREGRFNYSFTDSRGYASTKIYYRIKTTTIKGNSSYSKTVLINHTKDMEMTLVQSSPSAASVSIRTDRKIQFVQWFNSKGQFIKSSQTVVANQPVLVSDLPPGVYFLRVSTADSMQVLKMIKQ